MPTYRVNEGGRPELRLRGVEVDLSGRDFVVYAINKGGVRGECARLSAASSDRFDIPLGQLPPGRYEIELVAEDPETGKVDFLAPAPSQTLILKVTPRHYND